jgi:hypothetical protein
VENKNKSLDDGEHRRKSTHLVEHSEGGNRQAEMNSQVGLITFQQILDRWQSNKGAPDMKDLFLTVHLK